MLFKRNFSAILLIMTILSNVVMYQVNVKADSDSQFILHSEQSYLAVGDVIEITLSAQNISEFAGYQANIKYDPAVLKPIYSDNTPFDSTSVPEPGDLLKGRFSPTDMAANDLQKGTLTFGRTYMNLVGYKNSNKEEKTGIVAYLYFQVLKSQNTKVELQNASSMTNAINGVMAFNWDGIQINNFTVLGTVEFIGNGQAETPTPTKNAEASGNATPTKAVTPTNSVTATKAVTATPTKAKPTPTKYSGTTNTPENNRTVTPSYSSSTPDPKPAIPVEDLAIAISADKRIYNENSVITYTIKYKNRSNELASNIEIVTDFLDNTTIENGANANSEDGKIKWYVGNLNPGQSGEIKYSVRILPLYEAEVPISNTVSIVQNGEDIAQSTLKVLAVTNRFGKISHKKYVNGYKGNVFMPDKEITRAEAAVMFCNILEIDVPKVSEQVFSDVSAKHWAAPYIYVVNKEGIFKGFSDGRFLPNGYITRAEMATAISRYLGLSEAEPISIHFKDTENHWALKYIEEIYRVKITNGYKDGRFLPNNKIKRSEAVVMLNNMLFRGPLLGGQSTFDDVGYDHWAIGYIEEAANDHKSTRDENGIEYIE